MPVAVPVKAWSFSRLQEYRECPKKFYFRNVLKIAEPRGPALIHGEEVHDILELYVLKKKSKLVVAVAKAMGKDMKKELDRVRKQATPEKSVAFDSRWKMVASNDWDRVWLRVVVDLTWLQKPDQVHMIDYKTGKINEAKHADQLELYAIYGFLANPDADEVVATPWYVDHAFRGAPKIFKRRDLPKMQRRWERMAASLTSDTKFRENVGGHCKWCPYSNRNSVPGPCKKG